MKRILGREYRDFARALSLPPERGIRVNGLKESREEFSLLGLFGAQRVPWEEEGFYFSPSFRPASHPFHRAGVYYMQEPSAMAPARAAEITPGMRVLDLCAAPGGKSRGVLSRLAGRGLLVSNEISPRRAGTLSFNVERMGAANCVVTNARPDRLREKFPGFFDAVLVDAPCSGEGMFRKSPGAAREWSVRLVSSCASRQKKIIDSARRTVAPGGKLIYSTCTFEPEENEGVVARFLSRHPDFHLEKPEISRFFSPGLDFPGLGTENREKCMRLYPHKIRGEGHFTAVFRRDEGRAPAKRAFSPAADRKAVSLWKEFSRRVFDREPLLPGRRYFSDGELLYSLPPDTPDFSGLRLLRAGLLLGEARKGRFVPAHSLAVAAGAAAVCPLEFSPEDSLLKDYLLGLPVPDRDGIKGYRQVTVGGFGLGWGKSDGSAVKNHYPRGLRLKNTEYELF